MAYLNASTKPAQLITQMPKTDGLVGTSRYRAGKGLLVAAALLLALEICLHMTPWMQRYRAVFASGRLIDKLMYVSEVSPQLIVIGNSRIDNGIDPTVIAAELSIARQEVFNLGIPGANTRVIQGATHWLLERNSLSNSHVLLGLDPSLFSLNEELGYSVFVLDKSQAWQLGDYAAWRDSWFRLWGFANNLKGLREPQKMIQWFQASTGELAAWGGELNTNQGFRAKQGVLSEAQQQAVSSELATTPLDVTAYQYFISAIKEWRDHDVAISVFFPVVFANGEVISVQQGFTEFDFKRLKTDLSRLGVRFLNSPKAASYGAEDFFNPGHLNVTGAEKYSQWLAQEYETLRLPLADVQKYAGVKGDL